MEVQFVYPRSEVLRKHIEFFSFLTTPENVEVELLLFPNVVSILSISPNTQLEIAGNEVTVRVDPSIKEIQSDITGRILVPLYFRYLGRCTEICVVFKPLGVSRFFAQPLSEIAPRNYQPFTPDFDDWDSFTSQLFSLPERSEQVSALEEYFLGKMLNPNLQNLDEAVRLLIDVESNLSIADIAATTGFHQKQLERLCQKHLGCSPATFRRIARFRHSINLHLPEAKALNLTDTSYQSNFADQSHLGKEFRRLSAMSPKEFFSSTWKLPEYGIVWKLR